MTHTSEPSARYPIRAVSKLTGIAIDTLRAWERRYGAVAPTRDGRGRMYTDADVARLHLLNQAVSAGHSIGRIASLSDEALRGLSPAPPSPQPSVPPHAALDASVLERALRTLDGAMIDQEFTRLAAVLPPVQLVQDVLLPTLRRVGDNWERRRGGIAHEHLISSAMRHLLGSFLRVYSGRTLPVRLLFATLSGDRHELGILAAAMLAASRGLAVSYVGPDLPAEEIVEAVTSSEARVAVLGLTFSPDGEAMERELRTLAARLPAGVELWVGGRGLSAHAGALNARARSLVDFDAYLRELERVGGRA